jgi:hypothetical protein
VRFKSELLVNQEMAHNKKVTQVFDLNGGLGQSRKICREKIFVTKGNPAGMSIRMIRATADTGIFRTISRS